jgi:hypothetical protein
MRINKSALPTQYVVVGPGGTPPGLIPAVMHHGSRVN